MARYLNISESVLKYRMKNNIDLFSKVAGRRKCEIDGVTYDCVSDAIRNLQLPESTIRNRLEYDSFPNYKYVD